MLVDSLLGLMYGGVRIAAIILPGRIVAVSHVVVSVIALRRNMRIGGIIVNCPITSMGYRIISVRILPINIDMMRLKLIGRVGGRCGHFHLPQRVLGINAAPVIRI